MSEQILEAKLLEKTNYITVQLEISTKPVDKMQCETSHCTCIRPKSMI